MDVAARGAERACGASHTHVPSVKRANAQENERGRHIVSSSFNIVVARGSTLRDAATTPHERRNNGARDLHSQFTALSCAPNPLRALDNPLGTPSRASGAAAAAAPRWHVMRARGCPEQNRAIADDCIRCISGGAPEVHVAPRQALPANAALQHPIYGILHLLWLHVGM